MLLVLATMAFRVLDMGRVCRLRDNHARPKMTRDKNTAMTTKSHLFGQIVTTGPHNVASIKHDEREDRGCVIVRGTPRCCCLLRVHLDGEIG